MTCNTDLSDADKQSTVTDDEILIRLISYPGCISENKELSPEIFSLYHKDEDYVSVNREYYMSIEDSMKHGINIRKWPFRGDRFWGAVKLNARDVRGISNRVLVESYYKPEYKAHAGISYILDSGDKLKHTGDEIIPSWLLSIQLKLCESVLEVIEGVEESRS